MVTLLEPLHTMLDTNVYLSLVQSYEDNEIGLNETKSFLVTDAIAHLKMLSEPNSKKQSRFRFWASASFTNRSVVSESTGISMIYTGICRMYINRSKHKCSFSCSELNISYSSYLTDRPRSVRLTDFWIDSEEQKPVWNNLIHPTGYPEVHVSNKCKKIDPFGEKFWLDPQDELEYLTW